MGSFSIWHWLVVLLMVAGLYVNFRYCKSYSLLLSRISASAKPLPSISAYLLLVPLLNIVWQVALLINVRNSLLRMKRLNLTTVTSDGGFVFGIAYLLTIVASVFFVSDQLVLFTWLAGIVLWALTWNCVVDTRKKLEQDI